MPVGLLFLLKIISTKILYVYVLVREKKERENVIFIHTVFTPAEDKK